MAPWRDVLCRIFFKIVNTQYYRRRSRKEGGNLTQNPFQVLFVVLVSGYVLWVQKRGEVGQAALETAEIVLNYTFL